MGSGVQDGLEQIAKSESLYAQWNVAAVVFHAAKRKFHVYSKATNQIATQSDRNSFSLYAAVLPRVDRSATFM
jgi:hypothetical protein